jgi:CheY-like chemotaxis protein
MIEQSGHTLAISIPDDPVMLNADATRISQVLMNLLNNAAKYTEHGGRIELSAARDGESAVIRVKDTGVGIPADMLPRIFELFAQDERSIERSRGGLGIGLNLAQSLVGLHGGTLEAKSDGPGRGSEFVVRLPAEREERAGAARISTETTPADEPLRILVVDDNEDSAESMAMFLSMNGHEVRTAHDGLTAVAEEESFHPAAVLLDIGLPGLNGYEAAQRIRAKRGDRVVLVAVTGWGQEEDRRRSRQAGFDHHLTKPVELDGLRRVLSAARTHAPGP